MPIRHLTLAAALSLAAYAPAARAQRVDRAEHHEYTIDNFRTESGVVLPKATVVSGSTPPVTTPCCCRRTTWPRTTAMSG